MCAAGGKRRAERRPMQLRSSLIITSRTRRLRSVSTICSIVPVSSKIGIWSDSSRTSLVMFSPVRFPTRVTGGYSALPSV